MSEQIPFFYEKGDGDSLKNKVLRVFTSALSFILAFILSNFLLQLLIALACISFKYHAKFTYTKIYGLPMDYHAWSRARIIVIFFFMPIVCLIAGLLIFNFLRIGSRWAGVLRIFFFWLAINLINLVITHMLLAPLGSASNSQNGLYQTFAVVGAWLFLDTPLLAVFAVLGLILALAFGMLIRGEIMRYSYSQTLLRTEQGRGNIVFQVYLLPVLFGALPVLSLCTAYTFFTTGMELVTLFIISIGVFVINSVGMAGVRCHKVDILNHYPYIEILACVLLWIGIFFFFR